MHWKTILNLVLFQFDHFVCVVKMNSQHVNDGKSQYGGRDCVGYGEVPPDPKWPNGAKVRLIFCGRDDFVPFTLRI